MSEFKVGDAIVCTKGRTAEVLIVIIDWPDRYECVSPASPSSIVLKSHIERWRLATPKEIAAGHRIDAEQFEDIGDDRDMSQHISPNCKAKDI